MELILIEQRMKIIKLVGKKLILILKKKMVMNGE
jgi:hypothetical protein